jgi:hypothetical protein
VLAAEVAVCVCVSARAWRGAAGAPLARAARPRAHLTPRAARAQAYKAYATAAVHLDRPGAAQAARSVDNVLSSTLRFLGFVSRVERNATPPTLLGVLDGEALACYVSFSLTVRCVMRAVAWARAAADASAHCPLRSSERKPSGVATDVSALVAVMAHLALAAGGGAACAAHAAGACVCYACVAGGGTIHCAGQRHARARAPLRRPLR